MKILNFGSLNIDYVYRVDHFVRKGETLLSEDRAVYAGGKGLNQSVALGRAGISAFHAGCIGEEGNFLKEILQEAGINVSKIRTLEKVPTGHTIIQNDAEGDNCILLYGGANQSMNTEYFEEVLSDFSKGDLLILQNEINGIPELSAMAKSKGIKVALNPSPMNAALEKLDKQKIDFLFVNELEAGQLAGLCSQDPEELLDAMRRDFPETEIILTLGDKGAYVRTKEETLFEPALSVQAVDTTAAGDTFTGYYLSGIVRGLSVRERLKLSVRAAAISVTRRGAAPSIPYLKEVIQ